MAGRHERSQARFPTPRPRRAFRAGAVLLVCSLASAFILALACDSSTEPPSSFLLTVSGVGADAGSVVSVPAGISCHPDCSEEYPKGQVVQLTATPSSGWRFTGWSGDCTSPESTCQVTVGDAVAVMAHFTEVPLPPTELRAEAVSPWQVDLSWNDESITESAFHIEKALPAIGWWDEIAVVPGNSTSFSHTGLQPETTYRYRIRACKGTMCSPYSPPAAAETPGPLEPPNFLQATVVSHSQIDLTWNDNSLTETHFEVWRTDGAETIWEKVGEPPPESSGYSDTELPPLTTWRYRVRACTGIDCSAFSGEAIATTFPRYRAPSDLEASALSPNRIDLAWVDNSEGEARFEVWRAADWGYDFEKIGESPPGSSEYSDTGLPGQSTWSYRVRACGGTDCSDFSGTARATTPQGFEAPSDLEAVAISQAWILVTWTDRSRGESHFEVERSPDGTTGWELIATPGEDVESVSDSVGVPGSTHFYRARACLEADCTPYSATDNATTFSGLVRLNSGWHHTCGIVAEGAAFCWGRGDAGNLGNGSNEDRTTATPVAGELAFRSIHAGGHFTCGITTDGSSYCWGDGLQGQLGTGEKESHNTPVPMVTNPVFESLSAGGQHTCGLTQSGEAYCWGLGESGQLGNGSTGTLAVPTPVSTEVRFKALSAGDYHTCGLATTGEAWCWGHQQEAGRLGNGSGENELVPVPVSGGLKFQAIEAGAYHSCGITDTGETYCWGYGPYGQLGNGSDQDQPTPVPVAGGFGFRSLSLGKWTTCGLTDANRAFCWGRGTFGALGTGSEEDQSVPTPVTGDHTFLSISVGGWHHACGITPHGQVYCWGWAAMGQLGNGWDSGFSPTPVPTAWSWY